MKRDDVYHLPVPGLGEVYVNDQPAFLTLSENLQQHYSFDREGRFLMGFLAGKNYQRGLDNRILMKQAAPNQPKTRRFLSTDDKRHLLDDLQARVSTIRAHLPPARPPALDHQLDTILRWDFARLEHQRDTFEAIYRPVGILPPDQYLSVVLQAAEGCSWNRCTFCTFYRGTRFRVKPPDEFRQHTRQVREFLGSALALRKSVFLGDANALIIPQPRLLELLHVIHEELPLTAAQTDSSSGLQGIYAFLDIFGAERKSLADYEALAAHGVRRVYIGLETGDPDLFGLLNKPGSPAACVEAVQTIKAAGINVGIILLAGVGGAAFAEQHINHSVQAIAQMQLDPRDLVYLSPLVISSDMPYAHQMNERGIAALDRAALLEQVRQLKAALKQATTPPPRVALYNIEEFLY